MAVSEFSDVFVSYRRKDVEFVKKLVEHLESDGKEVWIDWEDIPPGSVGFTDDIKNGLDGADALIAVLSPDYLESSYCVDMELKYAISLNKKIIPIVYREFSGDAPAGIGHINWVYFTPHAGQENTFEESYPKVIEALEADLEHNRLHKRFLIRAIEWQQNNQDNSFLLRGDELENMSSWLAVGSTKTPDPTDLHIEYFDASKKAERARHRRDIIGISAAMIISIILAILSMFGFYSASKAENRAVAAEATAVRRAIESDARFLARNLPDIGQGNPFLSYGLALDLLKMDNLPIDVRASTEDYLASASALRSYTGHIDIFARADVSPNDSYILSGAADDVLLLWDLHIGKEIRRFTQGADVLSVVFLADSTGALVADATGTVKLWNVETGELVRTYPVSNEAAFDIVVSPDNKTFASATGDQFVRMFDIETGKLLWESKNFDKAVRSIAISPDGHLLGASSDDSRASLFDAQTGDVLFTLEGHSDAVRSVAFSPDSKVFVTGGRDSYIKQWDTSTGQLIDSWYYNGNGIFSLAYTPDGTSLYSGDEIGVISQWDIQHGTIVKNYSGHTGRVQSLVFTPDGTHTITASDDGTVILWNFNNAENLVTMTGHTDAILGLALFSDGVHAVSTSKDSTARLWDVMTGKTIMTYEGHTKDVNAVALAHDDSFFITASSDGTLRIWNPDESTPRFVLTGHHGEVNTVALNSDDTRAVSSSCAERDEVNRCTTTEYFFWDTSTGEKVGEFTAPTGWNYSLSFSADGKSIFAASEYNYAIQFDGETGKEIQRFTDHTAQVLEVVVSPDGKDLLSTSADRSMILWDIATGEHIRSYVGHTDWVEDAVFTSDAQFILSASDDGTIGLWDTQTAELLHRYRGHSNWIETIDISADDKTVITGAWDNTIRTWNVFLDDALLEDKFLNAYDVQEITCEDRVLYRTPVQCD